MENPNKIKEIKVKDRETGKFTKGVFVFPLKNGENAVELIVNGIIRLTETGKKVFDAIGNEIGGEDTRVLFLNYA